MMNIPSLGDAVPKQGNKITQIIGKFVLKIYGWRVTGEVPDKPKFIVIGAPHTSNWDFVFTIATIFALDIKVYWMGKNTLFRWPYGFIMYGLGGIPIDRSASQGVVDQMVTEFNRRDKLIICITPEGTRKKVAKWKTGFYYIAQGANVPVVLAYFDYKNKTLGFGPVITPSGDIKTDMEQIQSFYSNVAGKYPH